MTDQRLHVAAQRDCLDFSAVQLRVALEKQAVDAVGDGRDARLYLRERGANGSGKTKLSRQIAKSGGDERRELRADSRELGRGRRLGLELDTPPGPSAASMRVVSVTK